jgi:hypothetical protein
VFRPPKQPTKEPELKNPTLRGVVEKLSSEEGREVYAKRARSAVTPFGTTKQTLRFRQFIRCARRAVQEESPARRRVWITSHLRGIIAFPHIGQYLP